MNPHQSVEMVEDDDWDDYWVVTALFGPRTSGKMADGGQPDQQQSGVSNVSDLQAHLHQPPPPTPSQKKNQPSGTLIVAY